MDAVQRLMAPTRLLVLLFSSAAACLVLMGVIALRSLDPPIPFKVARPIEVVKVVEVAQAVPVPQPVIAAPVRKRRIEKKPPSATVHVSETSDPLGDINLGD